MNAIILSAGEGKRLRPLTEKTPKSLIDLFGKTILNWQISTYHRCNIYDISIVTGYLDKQIKIPNLTYFKNKNFSTTNMLETLFCAKEKLQDNVIISYGDIIFEKKVLEKLIASKNDISVVIDLNWKKYWEKRFSEPLSDAESLLLDEDNIILDIGRKVKSIEEIQGQYIGLIKVQNDGIQQFHDFYNKSRIKSKSGINPLNNEIPFERSYFTDFLRGLIEIGYKIKAIPIHSGWLELDSLHDYELYNTMQKDGTISDFFDINN